MADKMIRTTGVLAGLRIPECQRGRYVLISGGRIVGSSASVAKVVAAGKRKRGTPLMLAVPKSDETLAAYEGRVS